MAANQHMSPAVDTAFYRRLHAICVRLTLPKDPDAHYLDVYQQ